MPQHARWIAAGSIAAILTLATGQSASHGDERPAGGTERPAARIGDVAWIAGTWRSRQGDDILEERWAEPLGDCMVGTLRWLRSDAVWMYELMTISENDGRLVFRLKHFTRTLKGWEPQNAPVGYPIAHLGDDKVVFENPEQDAPRRFIYERTRPDAITVSFENIENGQTTRQVFRFKRAAL